MKTYPHVVEQSQQLESEFNKKARLVDPSAGLRWFAEINLLDLEHIGQHGLPDCYKEAGDFLYDFWPNLPWTKHESDEVVNLMLQDPRWPAITKAVKESVGLDMDKELRESLLDEE